MELEVDGWMGAASGEVLSSAVSLQPNPHLCSPALGSDPNNEMLDPSRESLGSALEIGSGVQTSGGG